MAEGKRGTEREIQVRAEGRNKNKHRQEKEIWLKKNTRTGDGNKQSTERTRSEDRDTGGRENNSGIKDSAVTKITISNTACEVMFLSVDALMHTACCQEFSHNAAFTCDTFLNIIQMPKNVVIHHFVNTCCLLALSLLNTLLFPRTIKLLCPLFCPPPLSHMAEKINLGPHKC